uniref:Molybdopterin molybdenumtransferase n=1 Tax=Schlesneria paludicola TaxID=360056 RepID=A0A7C4QPN0_9PLAN
MSAQEQFLEVIDRDEAERRFRAVVALEPLGSERIAVAEALGRVLAEDVRSPVDVPGFDRSNFDGFAVRAADTFGAAELEPRSLRLRAESLEAGACPRFSLAPGEAAAIATGGMLPRGADAIVMVEHAEVRGTELVIRRATTPGFGITYAGTDLAAGETVLRAGTLLSSRETGVLAAIGETHVEVWRKPRVAILSTGNELIPPGAPLRPACIYDSNAQVLADAVRELGGEPQHGGIVGDDLPALRARLHAALDSADLVLLSGGTSKGKGDLCYRVVAELTDPGIVVHGVALKPGKPLCLAATRGKPVIVLPGFPTSALFTFHEFVAPLLRRWGGRPAAQRRTIAARLAVKTSSDIGRTEYLLVNLVSDEQGWLAFPLGKGSGSVSTFSRADGFIIIPRHTELVAAGTPVEVQLLGEHTAPADLMVIGSHCAGLDDLLSQLQRRGVTSKFLAAGSTAGLAAARQNACDLAGIHLLDPESGRYNLPFVTDSVELIPGYARMQGIVYRPGDVRFEGKTLAEIVATVTGRNTEPSRATTTGDSAASAATVNDCVMVNRNQGSGTRMLMDRLLAGAKPAGYAVQPNSHHAVAAAVQQGRADWGLTIETVARAYGLKFVPVQEEHYDFVVPKSRRDRPAVREFIRCLQSDAARARLTALGFRVADPA